jgi:hypothetical protein
VSAAPHATGSKRSRTEERRRLARIDKLRRRAIRIAVVAALVAIPLLWMIDADGPSEVVEAEVIRTTRWRHVTANGSHPHLRATILIEGSSEEVIEKADGFTPGDTMRVWIRRGRVTGWPYFSDVVEPGDLESVDPY